MTTDDLERRVDTTAELLAQAVADREIPITGDARVNEAAAADLLGFTPGYLRALRDAGNGPSFYRTGVGNGRVSYRLRALAAWIEERHEDQGL